MFVSTYDRAVEEGEIKGIKIGMEKGMEKGIEKGKEKGRILASFEFALSVLHVSGQSSDKFIAGITHLKLSIIRLLRKAYTEKDSKSFLSIINKAITASGPITEKDEKQLAILTEQFFKK